MSKSLELLMARRSIFVSLTALLFFAGAVQRAAAQDEAELILTANTRNVFPVVAHSPPVDDAPERLERELMRLKDEHPGALLADAGEFFSLRMETETGYNLVASDFFERHGYSVVNLSARDAALSMTRSLGFQAAPAEYLEPLISSMDSTNPRALNVPVSRRVEREGGPAITFVSLSHPSSAAGMEEKFRQLTEPRIDVARSALAEARLKGDMTVAFSSLPAGEKDDIVGSPNVAPYLLVDFRSDVGGSPVQTGGSWTIAPPEGGEIYHVIMRRNDDASLEPVVTVARFLGREEYDGLIQPPVPGIGFPLPNLDSVLEEYFNVQSDSVRVDRVEADQFSELTTVEEPSVYHLSINGTPYRMYRIFFHVMDPEYPEYPLSGWPRFDFLMVMDDNSVFRQIYSRGRFPVGTLNTTLAEALNKMSGKAPEEWTPDPVLAAGIEDLWKCAVEAMEKAIELDKILYGEGGIYTRSR